MNPACGRGFVFPCAVPAYNRGMRVRLAILTVCLGLLTACTMWRQHSHPGWKSATSGEQFERLMWQDWKAKRYDVLAQHVSATFLGTTPEGTRDRDALLQYFREFNLENYALGDFVTQPNGPDLVVSYRAVFNGISRSDAAPGETANLKLRVLSVWQQTKSGWVLIAQSVKPDQTP